MSRGMLGKGEKARDENFRKRGKAINEKVGLYAGVGKAFIAARESGEDPYAVIEEFIEWERFVASVGEAEELALPADFDYLDHLRNQYRRLRGYAPALLEAFEFEAAPPAEPVLEALTVLREMNEKGKRKVPDDAPTEGVPVETPSAPERLVEAQSRPTHEVVDTWLSQRYREIPSSVVARRLPCRGTEPAATRRDGVADGAHTRPT
jgi:hypothetical protein